MRATAVNPPVLDRSEEYTMARAINRRQWSRPRFLGRFKIFRPFEFRDGDIGTAWLGSLL